MVNEWSDVKEKAGLGEGVKDINTIGDGVNPREVVQGTVVNRLPELSKSSSSA